jgi:uncharacterized membrane protein (DUF2068 family)
MSELHIEQDIPSNPSARREPASLWARWSHSEHARGLLLIGLFKVSKAVLSAVLGIAALKLMHHDIPVLVLRVIDILRIDPENRFVNLLLEKADLISSHELRRFSIITFSYAVVCLVEGTGLMLEKRWAEYFTVTLTVMGLPWESYEMLKHFTAPRITLLVLNLLVLGYLVWLLRRKRQSNRF